MGVFERGIRAVGVISSAVLCGCFPHAQGIDLAKVSNAERAQAAAVQVYTIGQTAPKPESIIGRVTAFSCKYLVSDAPASRDDALEQLQVKALRVGADALINVTFDSRGEELGANCWETVQASGTAVHLGPVR